MNKDILEPTDGESSVPAIPLNEAVPAFVDHVKLCAALRDDMQLASNHLLHAFLYLEYASRSYTDNRRNFAKAILEDVKSALDALDCTEHITTEESEGEA